MSGTGDRIDDSVRRLWHAVDVLADCARRLRHLSQEEPLLQARPDYPRPRIGRSHADELRAVFHKLAEALGAARQDLPAVFPDGQAPVGPAPDETPSALRSRLDALARLLETLETEAFQPPPPLPRHAPPYLADAPSGDLAGSKAVLLSYGLEDAVAELRNALLRVLNTDSTDAGGAPPRAGA